MTVLAKLCAHAAPAWLALESWAMSISFAVQAVQAAEGDDEGWWVPVTAWWQRTRETLRDTLGPPLHDLHAPVDAWLASLPMTVAVTCALGLYGIAIVWTWFLSRKFVFRGAPDEHRWRDLRIWATFVMLPYVAIYWWLGR